MKFRTFTAVVLILGLYCNFYALNVTAAESQTVEEYFQQRYPEIYAAIVHDTYYLLKKYNPHWMIKKRIETNGKQGLNFSRSILVGAKLIISEGPIVLSPSFDFSYADVAFADFSLIDLSKSNLQHTNALNADFEQALLDCTRIKGLDVRNANLLKTRIIVRGQEKYVTKTILDFCGVIYNDNTRIRSPLAYN